MRHACPSITNRFSRIQKYQKIRQKLILSAICSSILNARHYWSRIMIRRVIASIFALLILSNTACTVASAYSQLVYNDVTSNNDNTASSSYVAINPDNTIIASSYSNDLILHNAITFLEIEKIELQRSIQDLKFSPDGKTLAITISSTSELIDSVLIYDMENMQMQAAKERVNSRRSSIDWTPNSEFLAVANFQNGVNLVNVSSMNIVREYSNQHQSDVTCISFSNDGQLLLTGDYSGNLKLWNYDGTFTGNSFQLNGEITGCGFNYLDQRISAVSIDGNISTWLKSGSLLHEKKISKASGMQWSNTLDKLYVIEPSIAPRMLELDGSTFSEISSTFFIHKALDFDIHTLPNGVIEDLYIATDTLHISNYARPELREGYGQPGSDLDGDMVPDNIDNDDDGDSFLDEWDFNCDQEVLDCQRSPDIDNIRNVNLEIDGKTLIIDDTFTFGLYESAKIRNLTRRSSISDQQISYDEKNIFENAICQNIDKSSMINLWKNSVELSVGQVENGTLDCAVTDGLVFSGTFDPDGIKLMFRIKFDIIPTLELPLDLTITTQVSHSDTTITHLVENYPIFVTHEIQNQESEGAIWWKSEGSVTVNFEKVVIAEEENLESFIEKIFANIIVIIAGALILTGILFVLIRRSNSISLDLEDDEEDETDEDYYDAEEAIVSKPKPISFDQNILEKEEKVIPRELNQKDKSPATRKTFSLDDEVEESTQPKRRRVSSSNRNKQGPIMTTKRKVLGGDTQNPKPKKVSIKSVKKNVKTRKVRVSKKKVED